VALLLDENNEVKWEVFEEPEGTHPIGALLQYAPGLAIMLFHRIRHQIDINYILEILVNARMNQLDTIHLPLSFTFYYVNPS
jgi:hypothetical protein